MQIQPELKAVLKRLRLSGILATLPDRWAVRTLAKIEQWAQRTSSGDLAELEGLDERSSVIPLVTSTRDNCLGQDCPQFRQCHVVKARRGAVPDLPRGSGWLFAETAGDTAAEAVSAAHALTADAGCLDSVVVTGAAAWAAWPVRRYTRAILTSAPARTAGSFESASR